MRPATAAIAASLMVGCASAPPLDLPTAASAPLTATFVVYHGASSVTIDSLRLSNDTLYGRKLSVHPSGPREPILFPRAEVDSIRRAHPDRSALTGAALPFAVAIGLMVIFRASYGSD